MIVSDFFYLYPLVLIHSWMTTNLLSRFDRDRLTNYSVNATVNTFTADLIRLNELDKCKYRLKNFESKWLADVILIQSCSECQIHPFSTLFSKVKWFLSGPGLLGLGLMDRFRRRTMITFDKWMEMNGRTDGQTLPEEACSGLSIQFRIESFESHRRFLRNKLYPS